MATAQVNLASEVATIAFTPGIVDIDGLIAAVEDAGYGAVLAPDDAEARAEAEASAQAAERRELAVLAGAALLTAPLVLPMAAIPFGVHWMPPAWAQFALGTPVQLVAGARFYRGAWHALRAGSANMDVLVALGTSAAFLLSLWLWATGSHGLYVESAATVITLVLFGKVLERRAKRRTTDAIRALMDLQPATARVERDGEVVEVPAEAVGAGEIVRVAPGSRVPVDGTIASGHSQLDESLVTGESLPVERAEGDGLVGLLRLEAHDEHQLSWAAKRDAMADVVLRRRLQSPPKKPKQQRPASAKMPKTQKTTSSKEPSDQASSKPLADKPDDRRRVLNPFE